MSLLREEMLLTDDFDEETDDESDQVRLLY